MPGGVPTTKTPTPQAKTARDKSKSSDKPPPPEDITLETTDGLSIRATWYLGTKKKESIPIIMVHGWEGSRGEYDGLARFLQSLGHSSVIPDLRGHGDSKVQKGPRGETKMLEPDTFRPRDMESMVQDLEACKRFLMEKNNAGECNIEMLCLIGAEFGSILATHYAALDWSVPNLPAYKQGQDVKALVLLTPLQVYRGLTIRDAMAHPAVRSRLSVMLVAGHQDSKGTSEARRMFNALQAHHPRVSEDPDEIARSQELFLIQPETSLTGTKLLNPGVTFEGRSVPQHIALNIIKWRLENQAENLPWTERKNPLGN
jgi:pimeloyl-ACP methyl ester carboxylesterase